MIVTGMSSRNKYLDHEQRKQATVLHRCIEQARELVRAKPISAGKLKSELASFMAKRSLARLDYLEVFDPETLMPMKTVSRGTHLALAVFFGKTRLIDNDRL